MTIQHTDQWISRRVREMEESATIKMSQIARDLNAKGLHIINLSVGEPDFDTPQHIKELAKQALDDGFTKYTPVPGIVELRQAIQTKFKRDNDLHYELNQIVVSNGAKQSIANVCMTLLDEGDEAVIFAPYWVSYYEIVKMCGAKPVCIYAGIEQDYKVTSAQLASAINESTKLIIFSSPCNPTGSVYTHDELKALAGVIAAYPNAFVISDEIYEYIHFEEKPVSIGIFEDIKNQVITVNGFAKGFAMTGWRLGYLGAPKWIADACSKVQGQFTSGANSFSQKAAAGALLGDMNPTYAMTDAFKKRRDLVVEGFGNIPGMKVNKPQGAFYLFPDISSFFGKSDGATVIHNSDEFCEYLLAKAQVATVSGSAFGAPNCFRLSYAASDEDLKMAIERIDRALKELKF